MNQERNNGQRFVDLNDLGLRVHFTCQCGHALPIDFAGLPEAHKYEVPVVLARRARCTCCGRRGAGVAISVEMDETGRPVRSGKSYPRYVATPEITRR